MNFDLNRIKNVGFFEGEKTQTGELEVQFWL